MTWSENFKKFSIFSPNGLGLLRAVLALVLTGLLLSKNTVLILIAGALFIVAAITDYLDGAWARGFNLQSGLGKIVDPTADKFLILAPLAAFSSLGLFSVWWIVPVFFREIVITFCRIGWFMEGKAVGAEKLGKMKFCMQVFWIIAAYFVFLTLHFPEYYRFCNTFKVIMHASMFFAIALTVFSGVTFVQSNGDLFKTPFFAKYLSAVGVGLIPFAPGTWGSAVGAILIIFCKFNLGFYLAIFLFLFWVGYFAVSKLDLSLVKDPGFVVIDEVLGMFVTLFLIPISFQSVLVGFFLFRIFDILKPYPVRNLEKLPGYWGILCDDLGAGLYAWLIMAYFFM